jgi:hypothetical protein
MPYLITHELEAYLCNFYWILQAIRQVNSLPHHFRVIRIYLFAWFQKLIHGLMMQMVLPPKALPSHRC